MLSMMRAFLLASAVLVVSAAAFGQPAPPAADLSGNWILQSQQTLGGNNEGLVSKPEAQNHQVCTYEGTASVDQTDGALSGDATLNLVSGDQPCPDTMSAQLTGGVDGTQVMMGMLMGGLGTATFSGMINLPAVKSPAGGEDRAVGNVAAPQLAGVTVTGTSTVTQGNFLGATGTFMATPQLSVIEIPTLTAAGLALLVLLLLGSATFLLLRRRTA